MVKNQQSDRNLSSLFIAKSDICLAKRNIYRQSGYSWIAFKNSVGKMFIY